MTPEHERWAEALAVIKQHGDALAAFVTKPCVTLARARNMADVVRRREVIQRYDQLRNGTTQ
ncbi:hypothetical protein ASG67_05820 [Sphingomonas sp. Leaf339]|uniref:DUF6961 family protein n=1 Tax=Sphingomonas sp. Leaf339 TaxID=1736343 RepID=UPI0006F384E0|nr:hypothetical protein ASG67_05820 [Sphingomonas sp. Leaf339]